MTIGFALMPSREPNAENSDHRDCAAAEAREPSNYRNRDSPANGAPWVGRTHQPLVRTLGDIRPESAKWGE